MNLSGGLKKWMDYEKNVNYPSYIKASDSFYAPENGNVFDVKSFWIDMDKLYFFSSEAYLNDYFFDKEKRKLLFLIHPESESFYRSNSILQDTEEGPIFKAIATSSYRTVLLHPIDKPNLLFFVKLSLDKNIWNTNRLVPKNEVIRSIGHDKLLEDFTDKLPKGFNYFREVLGIIPKDLERGGMIVREIPKEILNSQVEVIPFFSLYTRQKNGEIPIIEMAKTLNMKPEVWVYKYIFQPFCQQYLYLCIHLGITTESHGQNILLKISDNNIIGFYYRDLNGFNFDFSYIPNNNPLPSLGFLSKEYCQDVSITNIELSLNKYFTLFIEELSKLQVFNSMDLISYFKRTLEREFFTYGIRIASIENSYSIVKENIIILRKKLKIKNK